MTEQKTEDVLDELFSGEYYTHGLWRLKKFLPKRKTSQRKSLFRLDARWEFYLTNPWDFAREVYWETHYCVQRGLYGYSDRDVWNINHYLASWMPDALRKLAKDGRGCAQEIFDRGSPGHECDEWEKILIEMAEGFEAFRDADEVEVPEYTALFPEGEAPIKIRDKDPVLIEKWREAERVKHTEIERKLNRSLDLLSRWYMDLWD